MDGKNSSNPYGPTSVIEPNNVGTVKDAPIQSPSPVVTEMYTGPSANSTNYGTNSPLKDQVEQISSPYESLDGGPEVTTSLVSAPTVRGNSSSPTGSTTPVDANQTKAPVFRDKDTNKLLFRLIAGATVVFFVLFGAGMISSRLSNNRPVDPVAQLEEQEISGLTDQQSTLGVQTSGSTLLVNGNVLATDSLQVSSGGVIGSIVLNEGSDSQTYTLPNSSGVFCLDSNNCNYLQSDDVITTSIGGSNGALSLGDGLTIDGSTIVNTLVQTSLNGSSGSIIIQGTTNQVGVSKNGNTITLTSPQDIGLTSSPTFSSITLSGIGTQNGNVICDFSNNCGYSGVNSSFVQGGNSFGLAAVLGTNDNFSLAFETNGATQATLAVGGAFTMQNSTDSTSAFRVMDTDGGNPVLNVDTSNERVGIGTAAPSVELDVVGDTVISDRLQVGPTGDSIDECTSIFFGALGCDVAIDVVNTSTDPNTAVYGINNNTSITPTGTNIATNYGSANNLFLGGANNFSSANIGVSGSVIATNSAGTVARIIGVDATAAMLTTNSTATVTEAIGLQTGIGVFSTGSGGTITTGYGLQVNAASLSGTGTSIGTNYGIYVNPQTNGTTDYGVAIGAADTQTLWLSSNADNTSASAGIAFGSSSDTNLYRSAANTLRTDDALSVGDDITVTGDILPSADDTYDLGSNSNRWRDLYLGPATLSIGTSSADYKISYDTGGNSLLFNNDQADRDFRIAGITQANLLYADAGNNRIGIGTNTPGYELDVVGNLNASTSLYVGGTQVCTIGGCTAASGSGNYIQNGTALQTANFNIQSAGAASVGAIVRGAASQTAAIQEWQSSAGTVLARITASGFMQFDSSKGITGTAGDSYLYIGDTARAGGAGGKNLYYASAYYGGYGHEFYGGSATNMLGVMLITSSQASKIGLTVKGAASQTGNLQEWQNSSGTAISSVSASGAWNVGASLNIGGITGNAGTLQFFNSGVSLVRSANSGLTINTSGFGYGGGTTITNTASSGVKLTVQGSAGQTANLLEWTNSANTVLASIESTGSLYSPTAPIKLGYNVALQGESSGGGFVDLIKRGSGNSVIVGNNTVDTSVNAATYLDLTTTGGNGIRLYSYSVNKYGSIGYLGSSSAFWDGLWLQPASNSNVAGTIRARAAQSANLMEWQNSAGTTLTAINATGLLQMTDLTNGAEALSFDMAGWTSAYRFSLRPETTGATWGFHYGDNATSSMSIGNSGISLNAQTRINSTSGLAFAGTGGAFEWRLDTSTARTFKLQADYTNASPTWPITLLEANGDTTAANRFVKLYAPTTITPATSSQIALTVQGAASQTANLQEWQSSAGTALTSVTSGGNLVLSQTNASIKIGTSLAGYLAVGQAADYSSSFTGISAICLYQSCLTGTGFANLRLVNQLNSALGGLVVGYIGADTFRTTSNQVTFASTSEVLSNTKAHIAFNTTTSGTVAALFGTSSTTNLNLGVRAIASQTSNLQEWQNSSGTALSYVDANGSLGVNMGGTALAAATKLRVNAGTLVANSDSGGWTLNGVSNGTQFFSSEGTAAGSPAIMAVNAAGYTIPTLGSWGTIGSYSLARSCCNRTIIGAQSEARSFGGSSDALFGVRGIATFEVTGASGGSSGTGVYGEVNTNTLGAATSRTGFAVQGTANSDTGATAYGGYFTATGNGTNTALQAVAGTASTKGLVVRGAASQTANLQEWQDSAGTTLGFITANGDLAVNHTGNNILTINSSNSGTSMLQLGASGTGPRFAYDPVDGALQFQNAGSTRMRLTNGGVLQVNSSGTVGTVEKFRVNTPTTVDNSAATILSTGATTSKGLVVQGAASQTANLQEWQNSSGTMLASVTSAGLIQANNGISTSAGSLALNASGNYITIPTTKILTDDALGNQIRLYVASAMEINGYRGVKIGSILGGSTDGLLINASGITTGKGLIVRAGATQSGNLQEWQDSSSAVIASMSATGDLNLLGGKALYSYGTGDPTTADARWGNFYNTGAATRFLTSGRGAYASNIPDMYFDKYNGTTITTMMMLQSSTGNLGIGTTNPGSALEIVRGTGGAETKVLDLRSGTTAANTSTTLKFTNSDTVGSNIGSAITSIRTNAVSNGDSDLIFKTSEGFSLLQGMVLKSNGNVGIGTSSPTNAKLEVIANSTAPAVLGTGLPGTAGAIGVKGTGYDYGVYGSNSRIGVYGTGTIYGVQGLSGAASGAGVYAWGGNRGNEYGLYARNGKYSAYIEQTQASESGGSTLYVNANYSAITTPAAIINQEGTGDILSLRDAGSTVLTVKDGGNVGINNSSAPNRLTINTATTADSTAQLLLSTSGTANKGLVVQGVASQTANLQEWQDSSGTALAMIDPQGRLGIGVAPANDTWLSIKRQADDHLDTTQHLVVSAGGQAYGNKIILKKTYSDGSSTQSATIGSFEALTSNGTSDFTVGAIRFDHEATGNGRLKLYTATGSVSTERARLTSSGAFMLNSTGSAGTVEKFRVNTPTTTDNLAASIISTAATTSKGLVIQGAASQTANLQEWQSSAGANLVSITAGGNLTMGSAAATAGTIRMGNNSSIYARNAANNDDIRLLHVTTGNVIEIGAGGTQSGINIGSVAGGSGVINFDSAYIGSGAVSIGATFAIRDAYNMSFGTTTGTKIGTSTSQKIGFFNASPIAQPGNTTDLRTAMINLGLLATGGATPLNLNGGTLTVGDASVTGTLVVTGAATFNNTLTVNGHVITGNTSGTTTVAAGAGAGTGASASIAGNDTSGKVTITTGTGSGVGAQATVTFANAYGAAPRVTLTPADGDGASIQYYAGSGTTTFTINSNNAPTDATAYEYYYQIME